MDLFKRISETVREFFDKLQPSQRFSLIALSAALVVSLAWMVAWSTSSDQVPLLPGAPEEAKVAIIKQLDEQKVEYTYIAGQIYVDRDVKDRLTMQFLSDESLPLDGGNPFEWLNDTDFSRTKADRDRLWQLSVQTKLEHMIRSLEPVEAVKIQLPLLEKSPFAILQQRELSATVRLKVKQPLNRKQANAIAYMVSRAVDHDLKPQKVAIVDQNARRYKVTNPDNDISAASDAMELAMAKEKEIKQKIHEVLGFIGDFAVEVEVDLDRSTSRSTTQDVNEGVDKLTRTRREEHKNEVLGAPGGLIHPQRIDLTENRNPSGTTSESKMSDS
jgi:flagellar biosynthesis/type III secretory pathway M-ring protein FliF/YscJ